MVILTKVFYNLKAILWSYVYITWSGDIKIIQVEKKNPKQVLIVLDKFATFSPYYW